MDEYDPCVLQGEPGSDCRMVSGASNEVFFFRHSPFHSFRDTFSHHRAELDRMILLLGIVLGVMGAFYNWFTLKVQSVYRSAKRLSVTQKLMIPFLCAGVLISPPE